MLAERLTGFATAQPGNGRKRVHGQGLAGRSISVPDPDRKIARSGFATLRVVSRGWWKLAEAA
jgi:hypothetical protein